MKCTAMKLSNRKEQPKRNMWNEENSTPFFTGEEGHRCHILNFSRFDKTNLICSYSFPFLRARTAKAKNTSLTITNIKLPDNIQGFNTGASLDKWSKKRVRWKSAKTSKTPTEFDKDFCYESLETDLSMLLNDLDEHPRSMNSSLDNLQFEMHTDIEKLLEESEKNIDEDSNPRRRKKKRGKNKNKTKTIRFSKPPSPQTEQVIRVDVISNGSANEDRCRRHEIKKTECNEFEKNEEVNNNTNKELKWNLTESIEMCDNDFIVKCKQLALRQRRRI